MTPLQKEILRVYRDSGAQGMMDHLVGQAIEEVLTRILPAELLPPGTQYVPEPPPPRASEPPPARVPQPSSPPAAYAVLGVSPGDPMEMIEAVWRAKAKYYHPDVPTGNLAKFQQLQQAYETIRQERTHVHR